MRFCLNSNTKRCCSVSRINGFHSPVTNKLYNLLNGYLLIPSLSISVSVLCWLLTSITMCFFCIFVYLNFFWFCCKVYCLEKVFHVTQPSSKPTVVGEGQRQLPESSAASRERQRAPRLPRGVSVGLCRHLLNMEGSEA